MRFLPFLLFASIFMSGCYQEINSDLKEYYVESCGLKETDKDSVSRFEDKFYSLTRGGDYREDAYYEPTVENIDSAREYFLYQLTVTVDTTWQGEVNYTF